MPHRRHLLASLAFCAAILVSGAALADGTPRGSSFDFGWSALQAGLGLRASVPPLRAHGDATRLRPVSARAVAPGYGGWRRWARGAGYAVGRRSAGDGLQGGAALALNDDSDLTASYRLTGFALGDSLDPELADVDERTGAPFLGVDIEF
jgi:hypothetical protein